MRKSSFLSDPLNYSMLKGYYGIWSMEMCFLCGSGFKSKDGVPEMVKKYLDKKVKLDEFITHKMTLAQVNDAIELMKHGKW